MSLRLHGYRFSVYTRIVRIVLHEKGLDYDYEEINPFVSRPDAALHPFGRVPTLIHGETVVFETSAITRYLDAAFLEPALAPEAPLAQARMTQVISIIDNYSYWPLVRQVFSHRVFRPLEGETADETQIAEGLKAAEPILKLLEDIAAEGLVLRRDCFTLACAHLVPMLDYFTRAPEGTEAITAYPHLQDWQDSVIKRASVTATVPSFD